MLPHILDGEYECIANEGIRTGCEEAPSLDMMTFFAALKQGKVRDIMAECIELLKDYQDRVSDIVKAVLHSQVILRVGRSRQAEAMNYDDKHR